MKENAGLQPHRPTHISEYAVACLQALAASGLGEKVSLGGAVGLMHYLDYRRTNDVEAWWTPAATADDQPRVIEVIEATLRTFGQVHRRAWGEVVSVELKQEGKTIFSFQVARRSAQLEPPTLAPWINVLLDNLDDLLASKMTALVERGAPRDFRDIYAACQAGVVTPSQCWNLWRRRQQLAGSDTDSARARLAIETHLARIVQHRPLEGIAEPTDRAEAERVRGWFAKEFLDAVE